MQLKAILMLRTIEVFYKNGKIIPLEDNIPVQKARMLVTFIEDEKS